VIPLEAFFGRELGSERTEQAKVAFFHYIDLCNEQVFLRQHGRISPATWQSWRGGIESNLRLPAFQAAWREIKAETTTFAELRKLEEGEFNDDPKDWGQRPIVFYRAESKRIESGLKRAA